MVNLGSPMEETSFNLVPASLQPQVDPGAPMEETGSRQVSGERSSCARSALCCKNKPGFRWLVCVGFVILLGLIIPVTLCLSKCRGKGTEHFPEKKEFFPEKERVFHNISEIVKQRCLNYPKHRKLDLSNEKCLQIVEEFKSVFVSKDPCKIKEEDYQPLIKLVDQTIPCEKVVFWSQTKELAHNYTKIQRDLFTLEDTLPGYMADGLTWCSAPGSADVKTESCPENNKNCPGTATSVFWDAASKWFAEKACGEVEVILNGSTTNAYNRCSPFVSVEVHELNPREVSTLHAWVIHERRGQIGDSCSSYSIKSLESILRKKYIKFTCQETSVDEFLQCAQNPKDLRCRSRG